MKSTILYTLCLLILLGSCTSKVDFSNTTFTPVGNTSDLLISEMATAINTDPLANGTRTHYVELYNGTGSSIDLANYAIGYYAVTDTFTLSNWSFTASTYFILKRVLPTGKCYVIASPQSDPTVVKSDTTWGTTSTTSASSSLPLQFSGNSAIALLKKDAAGTYNLGGNNYKIIDVFGSPLVTRLNTQGATSARNNIMWSVAGETKDTRNRTFWRKKTVTDPSTDWSLTKGTTTDNSQWQISADRAWDYSNIGLPTP